MALSKPSAKPLPPTPPPSDENIAAVAASMPVGSSNLPRLSDVLAALGLIDSKEIARVAGLLIERYPDQELLIRRGRDFMSNHLTAAAVEAIRQTVWAEAISAASTGKSVIVHDPVDLA